jgi:tetratricopeptide (TPR) repeat protein
MRRVALLVSVIALAGPAAADPPAAAVRAYERGAFLQAAQTGVAAGSSSGYAFAARSLLAQCVVDPGADRLALADRAIEAAQAALGRDPASVEARLQLALALGVRGRLVGDAEALQRGYPQRGRVLIDEALALAPNEAWAHALLGGWHAEVLRRGGAGGALVLGASLREAVLAFERARALAPDDPTIAAQYGVALLTLNPRRFAARAEAQLRAATAMTPRDAFEAHVQAETARLLVTLRTRGALAASDAARAAFS